MAFTLVAFHSSDSVEDRLTIVKSFPPDGNLVIYLEWSAEGIEYCEFRVPRGGAAKSVWPPEMMADRRGRHAMMTPSFLVRVEPWLREAA